MKKLNKCFEYLIYSLPAVLFFSYYPLISLGGDETMNYKITLPMIFLAVFDVVGFIIMVRERRVFTTLKKYRLWLLFPVFVTASIVWSLNVRRGILTVGVLWLMLIAIVMILSLSKIVLPGDDWKKKFKKVFYGSSLVVVGWCVIQCILDVAGVGREYTLMCQGCTYQMFGFPHPNGFAIEPQFMGNLLLAPALVSGWGYLKTLNTKQAKNKNVLLFLIFASGIFLTFSRGAIYAFVVGMIFLVVFYIVKNKTAKPALLFLPMMVAFLFVLNLQGVFAQVSKTDDTYFTGIAKAVNHLSLGKIELRGVVAENEEKEGNEEKTEQGQEIIESKFDGYVEESTDVRARLTSFAIDIWKKNFNTMVVGVGIGGAGQALYNNSKFSTPKEIVQNEYASLLLETGIIGFSLFIMMVVLVIIMMMKHSENGLLLALILSYGVTLFFFSGLPNALHIYIMPILLHIVLDKSKKNASV